MRASIIPNSLHSRLMNEVNDWERTAASKMVNHYNRGLITVQELGIELATIAGQVRSIKEHIDKI